MTSEHWCPGLGFIICQADTECWFKLFVCIVRLWGKPPSCLDYSRRELFLLVNVQSRHKCTELDHKDGSFFWGGGGGEDSCFNEERRVQNITVCIGHIECFFPNLSKHKNVVDNSNTVCFRLQQMLF